MHKGVYGERKYSLSSTVLPTIWTKTLNPCRVPNRVSYLFLPEILIVHFCFIVQHFKPKSFQIKKALIFAIFSPALSIVVE